MGLTNMKTYTVYVGTPEHNATLIGMFWNIFVATGYLHLLDEGIAVNTGLGLVRVDKQAIREVRLTHFPRVAKPIKMSCVDIRFDDEGIERTIRVTARQRKWRMGAQNKATLEIRDDLVILLG